MKNILNINKWIIMILLVMSFTACKKVVLIVDELPSNTPKGSSLFLATNFNLWDAGSSRYALTMQPDSTYLIELPRVYGKVEYKFTRGDWSTCEADRCGNDILNRWFQAGTADTIHNTIESWKDLDPVNCDSITIVVQKIPANTPPNEPIKIAGSFNAWNPGENTNYFLKKDSVKNQFVVTVPRKSYQGDASSLLTYKFVREDISTSEVDKFGREIDPRVLNFEKGDSVFVRIDNWNDLVEPQLSHVNIILKKIPENTPINSKIYLAGNFNDWNPRDEKYIFKKNTNGLYEIIIPRKKYGLSFKITRGSWDTEFADACGNNFSNQEYNYDEIDTLYYSFEGWKDLKRSPNAYISLILTKIPENTPKDAKLDLRLFELNENFSMPVVHFEKIREGYYICKAKRTDLKYGFIITRGSYVSQEVTKSGAFRHQRYIGDNCVDTLKLEVENWNDLIENDKVTKVIINKVPKRTPEGEDIYIAGQFNGWDPGDKNFILARDAQGNYSIELPVRWLRGGFKFTRGSWRKVEGSKANAYIENRVYKGNQPQIELQIEGWEDRSIF